MSIQIFRHNDEWVVLTESYALTFHQTLAGAMKHAATQVGASDRHGTPKQSNTAFNDW